VTKPILISSAPKRLVRAFRRVKWKWHHLSRVLGVNTWYLYQYLIKGKEPSNPAIRVKMFLPKHPRRSRSARYGDDAQIQPAARWWNRLTKFQRATLIQSIFNEQEQYHVRRDPENHD